MSMTPFDALKAAIEELLRAYGEDMGFDGGRADMPFKLEQALLKVQGKLLAAEITEREIMTGSPLPETATIQRLRLQPGDMLVISVPEVLRSVERDRMADLIGRFQDAAGLGSPVPVLVLDGGKSLQLMTAAPELLRSREPLTFTSEEIETADLFPRSAGELERTPAAELTDAELGKGLTWTMQRIADNQADGTGLDGVYREGGGRAELDARLAELKAEHNLRAGRVPHDVESLPAADLTGPEITAELERIERFFRDPSDDEVGKPPEPYFARRKELEAEQNRRWQLAAAGNRLGEYEHSEETCPGHVASAGSSKVCGRCGVHIDSLRPLEEGE